MYPSYFADSFLFLLTELVEETVCRAGLQVMLYVHSVTQHILACLITTHPARHSQTPLPDPCQAGTGGLSALPFPKLQKDAQLHIGTAQGARSSTPQGQIRTKGVWKLNNKCSSFLIWWAFFMAPHRFPSKNELRSPKSVSCRWMDFSPIPISSSPLLYFYFLDHFPNKLNALKCVSLFGGRKQDLMIIIE